MLFKLDRTIKANDVLTSLTIIISVLALLCSWQKDRDARTRAEANQVRTAAATTLVKLDRWQNLHRSLYSELQPIYVETSEMLLKNFDIISARDYLWKQINTQRTHIATHVLEEKIETAYVDLFAYYPSARGSFLSAIANLKKAEEVAVSRLLDDTQAAVMSFEGKNAGYTTAMLGNALRTAASPIEENFLANSNQALALIRDELYTVIASEDEMLLNRRKDVMK